MRHISNGLRHVLAAVLILAATGIAGGVQAQEMTVRGRVIGPDQAGVAGQRVVLHRVDETGGLTIAEAQSGADGAFELRAPASTDTTGVYFVAARFEDELYIAPPFRPDEGVSDGHLIQVGVPSMSATAMMGDGRMEGFGMPGQPQQSRNWLLIVVPLIGVAGVIAYVVLSRNRIPEQRRLLIRVAELDERLESAPPAQRESLVAQRDELMAQLRTE